MCPSMVPWMVGPGLGPAGFGNECQRGRGDTGSCVVMSAVFLQFCTISGLVSPWRFGMKSLTREAIFRPKSLDSVGQSDPSEVVNGSQRHARFKALCEFMNNAWIRDRT